MKRSWRGADGCSAASRLAPPRWFGRKDGWALLLQVRIGGNTPEENNSSNASFGERLVVRRWLMLWVSVLAGCASTPSGPPAAGLTRAEVQKDYPGFELLLQFSANGQTYAVEGRRYGTGTPQSLVFVDERLLCSHPENLGTRLDWRWASQPDGLEYLGAQLEGVCGRSDDPPVRFLTDAQFPVPEAPPTVVESAGQDSDQMSPAAQGAVEVLFYSAGIILSPFILAVGIPTLAVSGAVGHGIEGKRAGVHPGMSEREAEKMLGTPDARVALPGSGTEVLAYLTGGDAVSASSKLAMAVSWYVGVHDGEVIWTHSEDDWLHRLAKQAVEAQKQQ